WFLAGEREKRPCQLRRIARLSAVLGFPILQQRTPALIVVLDGWLRVIRRLLGEKLRAEESRIDNRRRNAEWRDLGAERLHPALEAEFRCRVGGNEVEPGGQTG